MQLLGSWTEPSTLATLAGGKGRGLAALAECGVPVPDWAVVGADVFESFLVASGLDERRRTVVSASGESSAFAAAVALRTAIRSTPVGDDVTHLIAQAYSAVGGGAVAIRSSLVAEDGAELSYAGQFDTFLNVDGIDDVVAAVRACWASANSERSISYRLAHGNPDPGGVAVIIQRLVDSQVSGVVFTVNPTTGAVDEAVVSAAYGLGEGLVSGAVDADTMIVDRSGSILDTVVGAKETRCSPGPDGGATMVTVADADRQRSALNSVQVGELVTTAWHIADSLGSPQDIEWALAEDGFWFLQTRPVTAVAVPAPAAAEPPPDAILRGAGEDVPDGEIRIWDNSNIIESFSGLTSPLTYTTAADIYGRVYRGYATSLRVPPAQLAQTDAWTPVMLGYFHGRVYYNLLHWYRMVGIAPGYPLNRKVLEAALGVAEPLAATVAKRLRPFTFGNPAQRAFARLIITVTYFRRLRDIDRIVADFLTEFYRVYDDFETLDLTTMSGPEAYAAYRRVEGDLVDRWGPLMVLDAILLTLTGSMYLLTKAFLPTAPEWFRYAVVGPGADVESAEPARAMSELAAWAAADPELVRLIETTEPHAALDDLRSGGHEDFRAAVEDYLTRYGYRSLDELKLEVPDLREDPSSVFVMLRSALARATDTGFEAAPGQSADDYLDEHLHGIRRRVYERLRAKVSRCAAHRERLRFARTRAFGMVKRLIRVMGRDLAARGVIENFTDVFELTVDELRSSYEPPGEIPGPRADLAQVVRARQAERLGDAALVAPERFETVGTRFGRADLAAAGWVPVTDLPAARPGAVLPGTPSCSGIVEGTAQVVSAPHEVRGGVLVAYRTDPGWVAALPSAAALVIERGSPLTHVAIVARELGVPTVVGVRDATTRLRTGMRVRVDGAQGRVTVLAAEPAKGAEVVGDAGASGATGDAGASGATGDAGASGATGDADA
ncbi:MAG: phosphoenolpyruvate synthase [Gordonia sp. (in: high G+C Gram-positive bacteria)]